MLGDSGPSGADARSLITQRLRQAIVAAMNNAQYIAARGGDFAGDRADGVVKPNLPADYAGRMGEVQTNLSKLPEADIAAIAEYLISLK